MSGRNAKVAAAGGHPTGKGHRPRLPIAAGMLVALLVLALGGAPAAGGAGGRVLICAVLPRQEVSREYEIKAAFLKNFLGFTEWPEQALGPEGSSIRIGILGRDDYGRHLQALAGKEAKGRKIQVAVVTSAEEAKTCHLLVLGRSLGEDPTPTLASLKGHPVLTVGETPGFVDKGGMIGFVLKENKVRFEISSGAARGAGIKLSSRLLDLALRVVKE